VRELVAQGAVAGGTRRNLEARSEVSWDGDVSDTDRILCADAQTSGGLLLAVAGERVEELQRQLLLEGTLEQAIIGRCTAGPAGTIHVAGTR
jgi:selenide,water dikinase